MKVLFTRVSSNSKTGPIATSISGSNTCPDNCSLKNNGCYAYFGPLNIHWSRLDRSRKKKYEWKNFIKELKTLFPNSLFRYGVAGDLPGTNNNIDKRKMTELINVCGKRIKAFCYTHKPVLSNSKQSKHNRELIKLANKKGFIVNLSADNLSEADDLLKLKIGPVVSIVPLDHPKHSFTPEGRKVLVCPEQTIGLTCDRCMLCAKKDRKFIVAFLAHGVSKNKVSQRATLPIVE